MNALLEKCRRENEERLRQEIPAFADAIIAERRRVSKWEIQLMVPLVPGLIGSGRQPKFIEHFEGDEYAVQDRVHHFRWEKTKPGQNREYASRF